MGTDYGVRLFVFHPLLSTDKYCLLLLSKSRNTCYPSSRWFLMLPDLLLYLTLRQPQVIPLHTPFIYFYISFTRRNDPSWYSTISTSYLPIFFIAWLAVAYFTVIFSSWSSSSTRQKVFAQGLWKRDWGWKRRYRLTSCWEESSYFVNVSFSSPRPLTLLHVTHICWVALSAKFVGWSGGSLSACQTSRRKSVSLSRALWFELFQVSVISILRAMITVPCSSCVLKHQALGLQVNSLKISPLELHCFHCISVLPLQSRTGKYVAATSVQSRNQVVRWV